MDYANYFPVSIYSNLHPFLYHKGTLQARNYIKIIKFQYA